MDPRFIAKTRSLLETIGEVNSEDRIDPYLTSVGSWLKSLPKEYASFAQDFTHIHYAPQIMFSGQHVDWSKYRRDGLDKLKSLLTTVIERMEFDLPLQQPQQPTPLVESNSGTIDTIEHALIEAIYDHAMKNPTLEADRSRYIPKTRVKVVKEDHQNQCQICGRVLPPEKLEIDHIFPHAHGGSNDPVNLMPLCRECNLDKGKRLNYYRSEEGRAKIKDNITTFVRRLPIVTDFGAWLKEMREILK